MTVHTRTINVYVTQGRQNVWPPFRQSPANVVFTLVLLQPMMVATFCYVPRMFRLHLAETTIRRNDASEMQSPYRRWCVEWTVRVGMTYNFDISVIHHTVELLDLYGNAMLQNNDWRDIAVAALRIADKFLIDCHCDIKTFTRICGKSASAVHAAERSLLAISGWRTWLHTTWGLLRNEWNRNPAIDDALKLSTVGLFVKWRTTPMAMARFYLDRASGVPACAEDLYPTQLLVDAIASTSIDIQKLFRAGWPSEHSSWLAPYSVKRRLESVDMPSAGAINEKRGRACT